MNQIDGGGGATATQEDAMTAVYIHRAMHLATVLITLFFFSMGVSNLIIRKHRFTLKKPLSRIRIWQLCVSFGVMWHSIFFLIALFGDFIGREEQCSRLMGLVPLLFIAIKMSTEFFLYDRAKVIHDALGLKSVHIVLLRWAIWLAILGLFPIFGWAIVLYFKGRVISEGICLQLCTQYQIPLAFMIGDFFLGSAMIFLFTLPVHNVARSLILTSRSEETSRDLYRIIRHNFVYSALIVISGFAGLVVYSSFFLIYNDPYFQAFAEIAPNADLFIIVILVHFMDTEWVPPCLRRCLTRPAPHGASYPAPASPRRFPRGTSSLRLLTPNLLLRKPKGSSKEDALDPVRRSVQVTHETNKALVAVQPRNSAELVNMTSVQEINPTMDEALAEGFAWQRWSKDFEKEKDQFMIAYMKWKDENLIQKGTPLSGSGKTTVSDTPQTEPQENPGSQPARQIDD